MRGFTLLEALVTMGLLLLVVGVGGNLMEGYSQQMRYASARNDLLGAAQVGLQQCLDELRESLAISHPGNSPSADLLYTIYDPNSAWLPTALPPIGTSPPGTSVILPSLLPTSGSLSVAVSVTSDGTLIRSAQPASGGSAVVTPLASGVASLNCSLLSDGRIRLALNMSGDLPNSTLVGTVEPTIQ